MGTDGGRARGVGLTKPKSKGLVWDLMGRDGEQALLNRMGIGPTQPLGTLFPQVLNRGFGRGARIREKGSRNNTTNISSGEKG